MDEAIASVRHDKEIMFDEQSILQPAVKQKYVGHRNARYGRCWRAHFLFISFNLCYVIKICLCKRFCLCSHFNSCVMKCSIFEHFMEMCLFSNSYFILW
jgi:hypothetical protein